MWGASLNGADVIADYVILPELSLGDSLVFPDMGAYTLAFNSRFLGLPQPICRYYKQGELIEWIMDIINIEYNLTIRKTRMLESWQRYYDFGAWTCYFGSVEGAIKLFVSGQKSTYWGSNKIVDTLQMATAISNYFSWKQMCSFKILTCGLISYKCGLVQRTAWHQAGEKALP